MVRHSGLPVLSPARELTTEIWCYTTRQSLLYSFEVFSVRCEDQMLGAHQENGLKDQLKPFALPVLERRGEIVIEEFSPFERLSVGSLILRTLLVG